MGEVPEVEPPAPPPGTPLAVKLDGLELIAVDLTTKHPLPSSKMISDMSYIRYKIIIDREATCTYTRGQFTLCNFVKILNECGTQPDDPRRNRL